MPVRPGNKYIIIFYLLKSRGNMKKLFYERPALIKLNEVTYGKCHSGSSITGPCQVGSGPQNHKCGMGSSTSSCTKGSMAAVSSQFDFDPMSGDQ